MDPDDIDAANKEDEVLHPPRGASEVNEEENVVESSAFPGPVANSSPHIRYVLLGMFSHLVWGLYPVAARYLQVSLGLPGLVVLTGANALALVLVQTFMCVGLGGRSGIRSGSAYALLVCGRGATNFLAANYTSALYIGIVTALAPFIVACLSWAILREDSPKCLAFALVFSFAGAVLAVIGQSGWEHVDLRIGDVIGIIITFVSIIVSAGMRIFMKMSSGTLTGLTLVSWQYMSGVPLSVVSLMTLTPSMVDRLENVSLFDIMAMLMFVFVFIILSSITQVAAVRHLGPTMDGSLQPLRLISTISGGRVILGESVRSTLAWVGLVIILVTLIMYVRVQPRHAVVACGKEGGATATKYGRVVEQAESDPKS